MTKIITTDVQKVNITREIAKLRWKLKRMEVFLSGKTEGEQAQICPETSTEEDSSDVPLPKNFLQTKVQKERADKELNDRMDVAAFKREIALDTKRLQQLLAQKKKQKTRRDSLKLKQTYKRLPTDVWLDIMRHTHINDIDKLACGIPDVGKMLDSNQLTIYRGMEVEQFSELKWLFGESLKRSQEQKQALKDCLSLLVLEEASEEAQVTLQLVDDDRLVGRTNVKHLQLLNDCITKLALRFNTSTRTTLCLTMFVAASKSEVGATDKQIDIFERQPVSIQFEIRDILEQEVSRVSICLDRLTTQWEDYPMLGQETAHWIGCYFSPDKLDDKMPQKAMGPWIAELAMAYILEAVLQWIGAPSEWTAREILEGLWFSEALQGELERSGSTTGLWQQGKDVGEWIGFNSIKMLEGTNVGLYLRDLESRHVYIA